MFIRRNALPNALEYGIDYMVHFDENLYNTLSRLKTLHIFKSGKQRLPQRQNRWRKVLNGIMGGESCLRHLE